MSTRTSKEITAEILADVRNSYADSDGPLLNIEKLLKELQKVEYQRGLNQHKKDIQDIKDDTFD